MTWALTELFAYLAPTMLSILAGKISTTARMMLDQCDAQLDKAKSELHTLEPVTKRTPLSEFHFIVSVCTTGTYSCVFQPQSYVEGAVTDSD